MNVSNWMSWEGGVDLIGFSAEGLPMPNVIVHVARMVHTPVGSAPSGMIFIPDFSDPAAPPQIMGFVSGDENVGAYFGPNIFAGTPFENAPVLKADIQIETSTTFGSATVTVGDFVIETRLSNLGEAYLINREIGPMPFVQQGVEVKAGTAELTVNGQSFGVIVPEVGMTSGPGAVLAPTGIYAR